MVDHRSNGGGDLALGCRLLTNAVCYIAEELTKIQSAPEFTDEVRQQLSKLLEYVNYMCSFSEDYPSAKYGKECRP